MYVTYTRIYGWSDYGGESSDQPGYRLENMMWMTLLVYDYIIPGESNINKRRIYDRILERCTPILVDGENKREKTAEKNMKYLKTIFEDKETQTTHDPHNA